MSYAERAAFLSKLSGIDDDALWSLFQYLQASGDRDRAGLAGHELSARGDDRTHNK